MAVPTLFIPQKSYGLSVQTIPLYALVFPQFSIEFRWALRISNLGEEGLKGSGKNVGVFL